MARSDVDSNQCVYSDKLRRTWLVQGRAKVF